MITSGKSRSDRDLHGTGHVEFVRLWTAASPRVHAYIVTLVFNWAGAEDLLQDVGVTAWSKIQEYDRSRDFVAWVCGIARNKVLAYRQKSDSRFLQSAALIDRIEQAAQADLGTFERQRQALQRCLEQLGESERRLLNLHETPGVTLKSIARESGRSVEALYKAVQRIRVRLFECVTRRMARGGEP